MSALAGSESECYEEVELGPEVSIEFKGAGKPLPLEINRKKPRTVVDVIVSGHLRLRNLASRSTLKSDLVHGTMCK